MKSDTAHDTPPPTTAQVELPGDENLYYITEFLYKGPQLTHEALHEWYTKHARPAFLRITKREPTTLVFQNTQLWEQYLRLVMPTGYWDDSAGYRALNNWAQDETDNDKQLLVTSRRNCIFLACKANDSSWIVAEPRSNAVGAGWLEDPAAAGLDSDKPEAAELMTLLSAAVNELINYVTRTTATSPAAESLRRLGFAPLARWIAARLDPAHQHLYLKHPFDQMCPIAGENFLHISWKAPEVEGKDGKITIDGKDLGKSGRTLNAQQLMDMVAEHRGHPPQEYVPPSADPQYKDSKIPNIGVDWGKEETPISQMSPEEAEAARPGFAKSWRDHWKPGMFCIVNLPEDPNDSHSKQTTHSAKIAEVPLAPVATGYIQVTEVSGKPPEQIFLVPIDELVSPTESPLADEL